jgi:hypothetical protein
VTNFFNIDPEAEYLEKFFGYLDGIIESLRANNFPWRPIRDSED